MEFTTVDVEKRKKLDIRPGSTVRVWVKIEEKDKTRLQAFEGLVIAKKHGKEPGATFTVRKISSGVGIERIFPLYSPMIDKVEILRHSKVRRAKLYYIRDKAAKEIRRKMKQLKVVFKKEPSDAEALADKPEPALDSSAEEEKKEESEK